MSTYAHAEDLDKLIWTCEHYENDGTYCYKAGDAYFAIHDYGQAKTYYEKSCNRKDFFSWGCIGLGRLYEDTKNYDQAKIYYEKACKLNDSFGCLSLDLYMGWVIMPSRKYEYPKRILLQVLRFRYARWL